MITKLTKKQEEMLPVYRDKWIAIGRSTEPTDRKAAEEGAAKAYEAAGLKQPSLFVWSQSPLAMLIKYSIYLSREFQDDLHNIYNKQNNIPIQECLELFVSDVMTSSVINDIPDKGLGKAKTELWGKVRREVRSNVGSCIYGQHDAHWLAYYEYFHDVCDLKDYEYFHDVCDLKEQLEKLHGLWQHAKSAGWWIPGENICFLSDRPTEIHLDRLDRLHNEKGAALKFADGFGVYVLHGVRVPPKYIVAPVKVKELFEESNAQVRMAVIRKEGYGKFIKELNGKLIDEAPSTRKAEDSCQLWEVEVPEAGKIGLLKVTWFDTNTDQATFLTVPRTVEEFKSMGFKVIPNDVNSAESVRLATMGIDTTLYEIVSES